MLTPRPFIINAKNMKSSLIFLAGLGLGAVLGILTAPEPGPVTRRKIRAEADKIVDKAITKKRLRKELELVE
jgi:gas vesicle protein